MWRCPACGREFETANLNHECAGPGPIDQYIAAQPDAIQPLLHRVRETIRAVAPDATEKIAWRMPTFWQGENLIHFSAFKNHLGIYPGDLSLAPFEDRLVGYRRTKGAIQFPYGQPIDHELIADITRWRLSQAEQGTRAERARRVASDRRAGGQEMNTKVYEYDAVIQSSATGRGGAFVPFPYDIRTEFAKGRVKVQATFDGEPYTGSIMNMGVKNPDGSVCYIIGILKDIRATIGKQPGDTVHVTIAETAQ
jgi:uncharacterized protein YdhG (YjbR/CyaY superfamily)